MTAGPSDGRGVREQRATLLLALLAGAVVAFSLGVYARTHTPSGHAPLSLGFHLPGEMKIWFTRTAVVLALFQLTTGLRITGHLGSARPVPRRFAMLHRMTGALAVALAVPVAYDCVAAFGYQTSTRHLAIHGTAGLVLFGAFAAKIVAVQRHHGPAWLIPVVGCTLFVALSLLWLTSLGWPASAY